MAGIKSIVLDTKANTVTIILPYLGEDQPIKEGGVLRPIAKSERGFQTVALPDGTQLKVSVFVGVKD